MVERRLPVEHDAACMCAWCLLLDMDQALVVQGLDPDRYRTGIPDRVWRQLSESDLAEMHDVAHGAPVSAGTAGPVAEAVADVPPPVVVPVLVADTQPGTWARFTGVAAVTGQTVTLSGAVVGGPQRHGDGWMVAVRDYRGNPDLLLFVDADAVADLVDDPTDHEARAAQALAPVYAPGAALGETSRRVVSPRNPRKGRWVRGEPVTDVSAQQLALWEQEPVTDEWAMVSVHRHPLPVDPGVDGYPQT